MDIKLVLRIGLLGIIIITLLTGCKKQEDNELIIEENKTVIKDQIYEGLEFINVEINNEKIKTIVINNTGVVYEGSKFSIKLLDSNNNILKELQDEVKTPMDNGTTQTIETKTNIDSSKVVSIEYSIIK